MLFICIVSYLFIIFVEMVRSTYYITTIVGTSQCGTQIDRYESATSYKLSNPAGIALDSSNNLYVASESEYVLKLNSSSLLTIIGGNTNVGFNQDNVAGTSSCINSPLGFDIDGSNNLYIAESGYGHARIRKISLATGIITTIAGGSIDGYSGDGNPATSAYLSYPHDVKYDKNNNYIYISDYGNNVIRKVASGYITTFAGQYGKKDSTTVSNGDGGKATSAIVDVQGIALDSSGNVYIADEYNARIRRVNITTNIISTFAGTGSPGTSTASGSATSIAIYKPYGIAIYQNNLYFSDQTNVIRVVSLTSNQMSVFVGGGSSTSNGLASNAILQTPTYLTFDSTGNLYVTLNKGCQVRVITTESPTNSPTKSPNSTPSPTVRPSRTPTSIPTTATPTTPTTRPTSSMPSRNPTISPTIKPTSASPSTTMSPSTSPTFLPTTAPSSAPTSSPTSKPSHKSIDVTTFNVVGTTLTSQVAEQKTKFYLSSYVGYFFGFFLVLFLLDKSKYGKGYTDALHESAYNSNTHKPVEASKILLGLTSQEQQSLFVKNILRKNQLLLDVAEIELLRDSSLVKSNQADAESKAVSEDSKKPRYSEVFYAYISAKCTLFNSAPILYAEGLKFRLFNEQYELPVGMFEDFVIFLCNNHPLFSCIYACKGSPLSRQGHRFVYILQTSIAFFLRSVSSGIIGFFGLPTSAVTPIFSILVITPLTVAAGALIKTVYTCSPLKNNMKIYLKYPNIEYKLKIIAKFVILPLFVFGTVGLLVLAAIYSTGKNQALIIFEFFLTVQVPAIFLELVYTLLAYYPSYYYSMEVNFIGFSKCLVLIGLVYGEKYLKQSKAVNNHVHSRTLFGGIITIEALSSSDIAIAKGWITECNRDNNDYNLDASNIYSFTNGRLSNSDLVLNPMMIVKSTKTEPVQTVVHQPVTPSTGEAESLDEVNNALFLHFQEEMKSSKSHEVISFEEWKTRRKQFKPETRKSFVQTFRKFEDIEHNLFSKSS